MRNKATFEETSPNLEGAFNSALSQYLNFQTSLKAPSMRNIGNFHFRFDDPILFFDGATNLGVCGDGGVIHLNFNHYFTLRMNCGRGSNMKAELLALWCVV